MAEVPFVSTNVVPIVIVVGLLRDQRLYVWYPRKLSLLAISRSGVMQGFEIVDLIFFCTRMHYEYLQCPKYASVFLIHVRKCWKYTINRWRVVYAVCASAGGSPLKQSMSSCTEVRLKEAAYIEEFFFIKFNILVADKSCYSKCRFC